MLFLTMVKFFLSSISFKALIVVNNFRDVRGWAPNRSREPGNENPAKSPQALCQRLSARRAAILPGTRGSLAGKTNLNFFQIGNFISSAASTVQCHTMTIHFAR